VKRQIASLAAKGSLDHLFLACHPESHPMAVASLFLTDAQHGDGFLDTAQLTSVVLTLDPSSLLDQLLPGRSSPRLSPCLLAEQIEFADVIALNSEPADADFVLAGSIASTINPRARLIRLRPEITAQELLEDETPFDFAAAFDGPGWRTLIEGEAANATGKQAHVSTFVYRARRPFHPKRFWDLLQGTFPGVFRAKGFFWLATQMDVVGGLSLAGSECQYGTTGEWWAAHRERTGEPDIPPRFRKEWVEPFGDRRQAIAFMGCNCESKSVAAQLDACLLTDSEMAAGEGSWSALPDPFPRWSAEKHEHHCDDHECCHH
jgi:G3E family GTPase